jgi:hypothetical protein
MDCRETKTLLTAFHDGELPDADRTRVEIHLHGCPECVRLLTDLVRADEVAGVPDPGASYWDRFNARVADRIERNAEGPGVAVLRPKQGWMRQQLRFLVPAVAAAALVVVVVRYGVLSPVAPTPTRPPAESVAEQPALDSAGQRMAKREMEPPAAKKTGDEAVSRRLPPESNRATEGSAPPSLPPDRNATAESPPVTVADGRFPKWQEERKKMAGAAPLITEPQLAATAESTSDVRNEKDQVAAEAQQTMSVGQARAKAGPSPLSSYPTGASSPCEMARTLAAQRRLREAEAAQRECLAQDPSPPTQEKGLIFLAELLDRQARFAEADAVLTEVHRQFPKSLPLDLYRQQRPMVQKQQMPVPVTR